MLSECLVAVAVPVALLRLLQPAGRAHFRYQSVLSQLVLVRGEAVLGVYITNILIVQELPIERVKLVGIVWPPTN